MRKRISYNIESDQEILSSSEMDGNYLLIDMPISFFLLLVSSPVFLINLLISKAQKKPFLKFVKKQDCLGRPVMLHRCQSGFAKDIALLWSVLTQNIRFCGLPLHDTFSELEKAKLQRFRHCFAGLFSHVGLHQLSGIAVVKPYELIEQQASASSFAYLSLLVKGGLSHLLFRRTSKGLEQPEKFKLFGITIHNNSMQSAVNWALTPSPTRNNHAVCKIGYFINVNSVNLAAHNPVLRAQLNRADRCFADGSGMRLAAKHIGLRIRENVNGTDMLPHLCAAAQQTKRSIYMLGAKPGVAAKAAHNLLKKYPNLNIAGTQDGYFSPEQTKQVISDINQSGADILLLAMGTPVQEEWLAKHTPQLKCITALAVGGLFDFYSGHIARALMWMRELGMEWVWRLLQEPKGKFHRYVIGNPIFLIQTFIFNRAKRGF